MDQEKEWLSVAEQNEISGAFQRSGGVGHIVGEPLFSTDNFSSLYRTPQKAMSFEVTHFNRRTLC